MGRKVVLFSGVILFALSLFFAGCGKKEEEKKAPPPAPAPTAPSTPLGGAPGEPGAGAPAPELGEKAPGAPSMPGETKSEEKKVEGTKTK